MVAWDGRVAHDGPADEACRNPQPGDEAYLCELVSGHDGFCAVFLPGQEEVDDPALMDRYERYYGTERAYFGRHGEVT